MRVMVNLSGSQGAGVREGLSKSRGALSRTGSSSSRTSTSTGIDEPGWGERAAAQLERDVKHGARGAEDLQEPRADGEGHAAASAFPWTIRASTRSGRSAASSGSPCSSIPASRARSSSRRTSYNERWLELKQFPDRARPPDQYPAVRDDHRRAAPPVREAPEDAVHRRAPRLARRRSRPPGQLFDRLPNVYTEIGAVLAELGRQPRFARDWFHQVPGPRHVRQGHLGSRRSTSSISASSRPTTSTSTTTASATRSGRCTG